MKSKRFFLYFLLLSLFVLASCGSGSPGAISKTTSSFDGTKELIMEPAWLYDSTIKLALFKNSKMPKDKLILTAVVRGAHIFADDPSLHFIIDGEIVSLKSIDRLTDINTSEGVVGAGFYVAPSNWSSNDYLVDLSFVERLLDAENVGVRLDLRKIYAEGVFSSDAPITARPAFRKFLEML